MQWSILSSWLGIDLEMCGIDISSQPPTIFRPPSPLQDQRHERNGRLLSGEDVPLFFSPAEAMLIPRHTEDEACPVLGEVWLRLVDPGFHGDGAFPTMHAALDRVGDAHLQATFLTAGRDKH